MSLRKRNGRWHWRFQLDERIWSGSTNLKATKPNRPEAQRQESEAREIVLRGQNPNRRMIVRPFIEAGGDFLHWAEGEHQARPSTHKRLVTSFASLSAFFGGDPVSAISEGMIEDYKSARRKNGLKNVTIRHDLHALSKFFQYATKQRWASFNPLRGGGVSIPSDAEAVRIHVLSENEEKRYFKSTKGNLHDLGRLMILQGCRPGELLALRQTDVDLMNQELHIRHGKTLAAKRTLTLTRESVHILAPRLDGGEWVFPSRRKLGRPRGRMNSDHDRVVKNTGMTFVLYDLRHTFATRLAQEGIDLASLAAILGHSGLRAVLKYVHPTQEHQRAAMLRYDASLQRAEKTRSSFGPVVQ